MPTAVNSDTKLSEKSDGKVRKYDVTEVFKKETVVPIFAVLHSLRNTNRESYLKALILSVQSSRKNCTKQIAHNIQHIKDGEVHFNESSHHSYY